MTGNVKATIRAVIDKLKAKTAFGGYVGGNTTHEIIARLEALIAKPKAKARARRAPVKKAVPKKAVKKKRTPKKK